MLDRHTIEAALAGLNDQLAARGVRAELFLVGDRLEPARERQPPELPRDGSAS